MASFGNNGMSGPSFDLDNGMTGSSLDLDHLSGSPLTFQTLPFRRINYTDMDKSLMVDISRNAMDELMKLLQHNSSFWKRSSVDGREVLNLKVYESIFPRVAKSPNNKWMEFFPNIVSRVAVVEVILTGLMGGRNGSLQLMYEEMKVLSPLVPSCEFYFLRFCQQIEQNAWAIVDVSYDFPQVPHSNSHCQARRLPSGYIIQDMLNGRSKITWIEHVEIEDIRPVHDLYRENIYSGLEFGATRRLVTLQRTCERLTYLGEVITSPQGKRSLMKLSQRMVNGFCSSINTINGQQVMISGMKEFEVCATLEKCTDPGHPNSMLLSAATTISVPFAPQKVFDFFRDERSRSQWVILFDQKPVQEVGHISCGSDPGNCISVLRIIKKATLISLVTIVVQTMVSNFTSAKMSQESVNTVYNIVGNIIQQIKAALNTC